MYQRRQVSFSFVLCNKYQINLFVLGFFASMLWTTDILFKIDNVKKKKKPVEIPAVLVKYIWQTSSHCNYFHFHLAAVQLVFYFNFGLNNYNKWCLLFMLISEILNPNPEILNDRDSTYFTYGFSFTNHPKTSEHKWLDTSAAWQSNYLMPAWDILIPEIAYCTNFDPKWKRETYQVNTQSGWILHHIVKSTSPVVCHNCR